MQERLEAEKSVWKLTIAQAREKSSGSWTGDEAMERIDAKEAGFIKESLNPYWGLDCPSCSLMLNNFHDCPNGTTNTAMNQKCPWKWDPNPATLPE